MICPKCRREFARLLAVSRRDQSSICDECGVTEAFEDYYDGRKPTPYERTRAQVYATGNKWAIENFNATH